MDREERMNLKNLSKGVDEIFSGFNRDAGSPNDRESRPLSYIQNLHLTG